MVCLPRVVVPFLAVASSYLDTEKLDEVVYTV